MDECYVSKNQALKSYEYCVTAKTLGGILEIFLKASEKRKKDISYNSIPFIKFFLMQHYI